MTTMELHMNNIDSGINSDVKLTPNDGSPNTQEQGGLKRKSTFDSTYVKPLGIIGVVILLGLIIFAVKAMTPEPTVRTVDGGEVNTIRVDGEIDGRDQLDANQAKYLSEKDRMEAAKNAREGVSSAPVLNRAEATTDFTTYENTEVTDVNAVTKTYQSNPKTVAQLDAENLAADGELYAKGVDDDGYVYYTSKETGQAVIPIDKQLAEGVVAPNATANTNYDYDANNGGQNGGQNNNYQGQNNGGQNNGQAQSTDDDQQQQPAERLPDPVIEAKRTQLGADYEAYQAQQAELDARENQLAQEQQARYMNLQQQRQGVASQSLSESLARVQQSVGSDSKGSYTAVPYIPRSGGGGSANQNNNQANNQSGQYNNQGYQTNNQGNQGNNYLPAQNQIGQSQGQGYGSNGYGQGIPEPYANNNGFSYQGDQSSTLDMLPNSGGYGVAGSMPVIGGYSPNGGMQGTTSQGGQYINSSGQGAQYGNNTTTLNNAQNGEIIDQRLPKNMIRAGTKWQAVVTKSVNTDEGLQVVAELVTGKFAGSTVYGIVQPSGQNIGVQFQSIAPPNPRKPLIPIQAYATTIGSQKTAISNDINRHYARNYGIKGLSAVLRGVGEAYEGAGETSIITDSGNVITTKDSKPDASKIKADVLGELGKDLTDDISKLGDRPPTYKVPIGTIVNVVLSNDLDVNGTTSSIALGS